MIKFGTEPSEDLSLDIKSKAILRGSGQTLRAPEYPPPPTPQDF